jgi:hypothetical protein
LLYLIPISITPGADTVTRGDTLWLTLNTTDSLLDLRSQQRYYMPRQKLALAVAVGFREFSGPTQVPGSNAADFTVVNQIGQLLPGGATFRPLEPVYAGQRYRARIGLIPHRTGVYGLNLLSVVEVPKPLPLVPVASTAKGEPRRAVVDDIYYIINKGEVHFGLQQQHSLVTSTKPNAPEAAVYYEQQGTFTFTVR